EYYCAIGHSSGDYVF
nr:immunoglobulin light chain junction region [Macaca mulatta]MOX79379.1 immunoglobulin light chain junction region [Macaca mulatta]MOX79745.1 immunoglobulin light chain junction region [Macaca mulatta]MOX80404.1 immunoglobulin light chain junction region [Macaca mulatta]